MNAISAVAHCPKLLKNLQMVAEIEPIDNSRRRVSITPGFLWCAHRESNPGPPACDASCNGSRSFPPSILRLFPFEHSVRIEDDWSALRVVIAFKCPRPFSRASSEKSVCAWATRLDSLVVYLTAPLALRLTRTILASRSKITGLRASPVGRLRSWS